MKNVELGDVSIEAVVTALRKTVVESRVRIRELEAQRENLRLTFARKDNELREDIKNIETRTKTAREALKALAPPKDPFEMKIEVQEAVYRVLLEASKDLAVSQILPLLSDLSWDYEGKGFEGRVRTALHELEDRGLVKHREVETQSKHKAHLWSVKNKRKKFTPPVGE